MPHIAYDQNRHDTFLRLTALPKGTLTALQNATLQGIRTDHKRIVERFEGNWTSAAQAYSELNSEAANGTITAQRSVLLMRFKEQYALELSASAVENRVKHEKIPAKKLRLGLLLLEWPNEKDRPEEVRKEIAKLIREISKREPMGGGEA